MSCIPQETKKKGMPASWSDDDSEEKQDDETANHVMAFTDRYESHGESCDNDVSYEELVDGVLNPNVVHGLEILRQHVWKGNDSRIMGPRVYTDEEEIEATIRYLKNCSAIAEEPFIQVCLELRKRRNRRVFKFIILDPRVGYLIDSWSFLSYFSFIAPFIFPFVCFAFNFCV